MKADRFNLAIETSSRQGSIALGRGDQLLASLNLTQHQRHNVELMPAIEQLCQQHHCEPSNLAEIYVSTGPGSFTGLRIAVATAKALAMALDVKLVAVPTLDVLARQAPPPADRPSSNAADSAELDPLNPQRRRAEQAESSQAAAEVFKPGPAARLAICLSLKRAAAWTGLYQWTDDRWVLAGEPSLMTAKQIDAALCETAAILGDPLPDELAGDVRVLDATHAQPRAESTWSVGRRLAGSGRFVDAAILGPLYVRPPEAVEIWDARYGKGQGPDGLTPSLTPTGEGRGGS